MQKTDTIARNPISIDNIDIRLIRIFIRVVEAGGLSAAQTDPSLLPFGSSSRFFRNLP